MAKKLPLNQSGLSLLEILLAITICGMVIFMLGSFSQSIGLIGSSSSESTIKQIALKTVEDLRSQGYDNLTTNTTTPITDSRLSKIPQASGQVDILNCPVNICANNEQAKQVNVSLTWSEANKKQTFQFVTIIAKGGLN